MRTGVHWDSEPRRARRRQMLQTGLLVATGVAVPVIAIVGGRAVLDAQERMHRATDRALRLQEVRGRLRDGFQRLWSNRFRGRPGVPAGARRAFAEEAIEIQRLGGEL